MLERDLPILLAVRRDKRPADELRLQAVLDRPGHEGLAAEVFDVLARNAFGASPRRDDRANARPVDLPVRFGRSLQRRPFVAHGTEVADANGPPGCAARAA